MNPEEAIKVDGELQKQCTCGGMGLNTFCSTWCGIFGPLKCHEEVGNMHSICGSQNVVAHVDKFQNGLVCQWCRFHRDQLTKLGYKFRELGS